MIVGGRVKKIVLSIFFIVYIIVTLTITFFLNKYNDFGVIELKNKLIVTSNKTDMNYSRGAILVINKDNSDLKENDDVFYYTVDRHKILVSKGKIMDIENITDKEQTLTLDNTKKYSSEYIIGNVSQLKKVPFLGYILMAFTSKIGYLIAILLPISAFFVIQVYSLIKRKYV